MVLEGNTFQTAPVRNRRMEPGFSDLDAITASNDDDITPRSFRRAMYDEELFDALTEEERRSLRERAQEMVAQQRQLERRLRRAAEEERSLRARTADDSLDWEFI